MANEREAMKVSTRVLYDELLRQGADVQILDANLSLLEYKDARGESHLLYSTCSDKSSAVGVKIANDKLKTAVLARKLGIRIPESRECTALEEATAFFDERQCVVVKPSNGSGGSGVVTDIRTRRQLEEAFNYTQSFSDKVIVQECLKGGDLRLLVVAGEFSSAVHRIPAQITGDGHSTIRQLIEQENASEKRGVKAMSSIEMINMESAEQFLGDRINTVPDEGEVVRVVGPANVSLGGTVEEATHIPTEAMIRDAEKLAKVLKLGICGVDFIFDQETGEYALIEVNATPGVNMHISPVWGTSSDAVEKYVKWLIA